jgi:Multicopper oxidase
MGHCPHRTAGNWGLLSDPCRTTTGDNFTEDAHPIHIHEITFDVVDRQNVESGAVRGLEPWETGRKDTVIAYPGESTRVKATYERPGLFVWHCQIVEHEDHEMMRTYRVVGAWSAGGPSELSPRKWPRCRYRSCRGRGRRA